MSSFGTVNQLFNVIFCGSLILFAVIFVIVIITIVSPKARSKMMGRQIKAMRYMMDDNREDLEKMATMGFGFGKDTLKKAQAVKDGFEDNNICCKYCKAIIDNDSMYCKVCGKRQY